MDNQQPTNSEILQVITKQGESIQTLTTAVQDTLEIVLFLKDNVMTREETERRLTEVKSEIITHVDALSVLHKKFDQELAALQGKYQRHEELFDKLLKHLHLDLHSL